MKNFFTFVFLMTFSAFIFGQDTAMPDTNQQVANQQAPLTMKLAEPAENKLLHHLGLYGGMTTGYGLAYRFMDDWGIQIVGLPYISASSTLINLGITGLKTLHKTK